MSTNLGISEIYSKLHWEVKFRMAKRSFTGGHGESSPNARRPRRIADSRSDTLSSSPVRDTSPHELDINTSNERLPFAKRVKTDTAVLDDQELEMLLAKDQQGLENGRMTYIKKRTSRSIVDASHPQLVEQDIDAADMVRTRRFHEEEDSLTAKITELENDPPADPVSLEPARKLRKTSRASVQRSHYANIQSVRLRYVREHKIPTVLFANELVQKVQKHLHLVEQILSGKRASLYYDNARQAFSSSEKAVMSMAEFRQLDLNKFTAGFYGVKRQMRVALEILARYRPLLEKKNNAVLKWWGVKDFAQYVLAPELLSALCQEEMSLPLLEDAWDVMEHTTEFGHIVADNDPLEEWEVAAEEAAIADLGIGKEYSSMFYRRDSNKADPVKDENT
ncbi:LADA_0H02828g1_1 [Lachancea dasiensis]|uniref:Restriction of telomere capping protein 4 n=1 Tax=Lachancea dasiensis TaxID=1072105 RepID=A0A1G4K045_9SACH|nr:LADA_0H02828g1_1 [Lachancea dasiensis]